MAQTAGHPPEMRFLSPAGRLAELSQLRLAGSAELSQLWQALPSSGWPAIHGFTCKISENPREILEESPTPLQNY